MISQTSNKLDIGLTRLHVQTPFLPNQLSGILPSTKVLGKTWFKIHIFISTSVWNFNRPKSKKTYVCVGCLFALQSIFQSYLLHFFIKTSIKNFYFFWESWNEKYELLGSFALGGNFVDWKIQSMHMLVVLLEASTLNSKNADWTSSAKCSKDIFLCVQGYSMKNLGKNFPLLCNLIGQNWQQCDIWRLFATVKLVSLEVEVGLPLLKSYKTVSKFQKVILKSTSGLGLCFGALMSGYWQEL